MLLETPRYSIDRYESGEALKRSEMKLKRAIVLCALMIFSLGSLALGHASAQNNNRNRTDRRENGNGNRMDRRGNSNRGNSRRWHRRRHRRHNRNSNR
jgi:hypothetical protein